MGNCGVGFAPCRPGRPRRARRRDGGRRGHPRCRDGRRAAVDLGDLPRVPGRAGRGQARHRRGRVPAALAAAGVRDGPARRRPRAGDRRGPREDAEAGQGGDRGRRAGLRVVAVDLPQDRERARRSRATTPPTTRSRRSPQGVDDAGGGLLQFVPDLPAGGYEPVLQHGFRRRRGRRACRSRSRWRRQRRRPDLAGRHQHGREGQRGRRRRHRADVPAPDRAGHRPAS